MGNSAKYKIGDKITTNEGFVVEIIDAISIPKKSILYKVKFLDEFGAEKLTRSSELNIGCIRNPYNKGLFGVGFIGEGKYNCANSPDAYLRFRFMLERCYSPEWHARFPTYIGVTVDPKWHNFQNFAEWFNTNPWNFKGYELDKDILSPKDAKIYSENTCALVPKAINYLVCGVQSKESSGIPTGVRVPTKFPNRYEAACSVGGKQKWLGYFDCPDEAFEAYKVVRLNHIRATAEEWKGKIDPRVYDALMNMEVNKYA